MSIDHKQKISRENCPDVTIAVNSYRNPHMLRLCVQSILHTTAHTSLRTEILVADCATQEETYDLMRQEFPQVVFLPDRKNIGFGAMVNKCLAHAHGRYVFLINADTILEKNTVAALYAYAEEHPRIGIVAPAQRSFNGKIVNTCFRFYTPWIIVLRRVPFLGSTQWGRRILQRFEMTEYDRRAPRAVDWVIGSAMFVRRDMQKIVGGLDPRFFMYMEDVDWCRRFWVAGYHVVYHPGITLYHYYGKGSAAGGLLRSLLLNRLTWIHIASAWKYFVKYAGQALPRHE